MLNALLETVKDGIFVVNLEGYLIEANKNFADLLGYTQGELIGKHLIDISPGATPDFSAEHEIPTISKLNAKGYLENQETQYTRKDGSVFFAEVNVGKVRDEDGNIINYLTAVRETKRKAGVLKLRENEDFIHKIMFADPNLIFVKHKNGQYIEISDGLAMLFGEKPDAVIGKTDLYFANHGKMSITEAKKIREDDLSVIETGKQKFIPEESVTLPDGTLKWYQTTKIPLFRKNKVEFVLGVAVDITERKQALDLLKKREQELAIKTQNLEELNIALNVLLKHKESNSLEISQKVLSTTKTLIEPFMKKLACLCPDSKQQNLIDIINANLQEIVSGFSGELSSTYMHLTTTEIQVADFVKNAYSNKEISELLNMAIQTVAAHRKNIRRKLGIKNTKTNLASHLKSIF